jgi:hypothetical protein
MGTVVVRYRPEPDRADENQRLVEAVYEELAATNPAGFRYVTFRLEDGTFVHISDTEGDTNPLDRVAAFKEFVKGVGERCQPENKPNAQPATVVGSYRFPVAAAGS